MAGVTWVGQHWFEFLQSVGVVAGLLFTAWSVRRDERARQIGNLIALNERHNDIWSKLYGAPHLSRVLENQPDLRKQPITNLEFLFVKMLILHLDTVRRATGAGMFVKLHRIRADIRAFLSLPIPKQVWEQLKPFQDEDFISFVEDALR